MTINAGTPPTLDQLERSARRLLEERVFSKGGKRPSEEVISMAVRVLALKALRELASGKVCLPKAAEK
jgi:hypothetical protein